MTKTDTPHRETANETMRRRAFLQTATAAAVALAASGAGFRPAIAGSTNNGKDIAMSPGAFVYTELQISVPFDQVPWKRINISVQEQPGFLNKTWLSGLSNQSAGGIYAFDSIENAQKFVTGYFPAEAAAFGVAQTTRVFDAAAVREASMDIGSPHFGVPMAAKPGAFVYTEVQVDVPFDKAPWAERNPVLKQQKGLLAKTWLSGVNAHTIGGIDAFDTVENAIAFAVQDFPNTARKMNAAFYTRVFDADATSEASRAMNSPYYG
ncbi:MAG: YdhR family protein [Tepidamorphaceae bacterium]